MRSLTLLLCALLAPAALAADKKFELRGVGERGEKTYKTYCHHCHGDKGDGTGHIGRGLTTKPVNFTDAATAQRLTPQSVYTMVKDGAAAHGGTVLMIPWSAVLRDDEIRDVVAYTLSLIADAAALRAAKAPEPKR